MEETRKNMKTKIWMYIEDEDANASVKGTFDPDDDIGVCISEEVATYAQNLLAGFGYPRDVANDIQSIGWERLTREKPNEQGQYLVSIPESDYMKTYVDDWDGTRFIKYDNKVVFWAFLPGSPGFWAYGG